jgi:hypothetical protein
MTHAVQPTGCWRCKVAEGQGPAEYRGVKVTVQGIGCVRFKCISREDCIWRGCITIELQ